MTATRRAFLGGAMATAAAAGLAGPATRALAAAPRARTGSLDDVEHVVILMQENRSVDHYYGTMRGVRGFGDTTVLRRADGHDIFHQPAADRPENYLLPYHADTHQVDSQDLAGNDHSWDGVQQQWAGGALDGFYTDSGATSLAYFGAADIPFHRALAQAFTFCDHYFASIKGPTRPNRLFHWTGTIDPTGQAGGPATHNPGKDYVPLYHWTTYPERLQAAGVSWRVFANDEVGDQFGEDGWVGDFGDNPLWLFQSYHDALRSSDPAERELASRASVRASWKPNSGLGHNVTHVLADFLDACADGSLPQVSWIVAPYRWTEHPAARPVDGALYTQTVLNALWSNENLRDNTVVLLNYDEHDGFFDHVIPPTAPPGTPGEWVDGQPVGLGPRVPMTVVSPWSRGGWIDSQIFDHTSVLRFLEAWTGVRESNISAWRRSICGDLLSSFDFTAKSTTIPSLPDCAALRREADARDSSLPQPTPPAPGEQTVPQQDTGVAPARALPYQLGASLHAGDGVVYVKLANLGTAAAQVQVYNHADAHADVGRYDVAPGSSRSEWVSTGADYDVAVHGPNRFLRTAIGVAATEGVEGTLSFTGPDDDPQLRITLDNGTDHVARLLLLGLGEADGEFDLDPGASRVLAVPLDNGWYDVRLGIVGRDNFARRYVGHVENGRPSVTG